MSGQSCGISALSDETSTLSGDTSTLSGETSTLSGEGGTQNDEVGIQDSAFGTLDDQIGTQNNEDQPKWWICCKCDIPDLEPSRIFYLGDGTGDPTAVTRVCTNIRCWHVVCDNCQKLYYASVRVSEALTSLVIRRITHVLDDDIPYYMPIPWDSIEDENERALQQSANELASMSDRQLLYHLAMLCRTNKELAGMLLSRMRPYRSRYMTTILRCGGEQISFL